MSIESTDSEKYSRKTNIFPLQYGSLVTWEVQLNALQILFGTCMGVLALSKDDVMVFDKI